MFKEVHVLPAQRMGIREHGNTEVYKKAVQELLRGQPRGTRISDYELTSKVKELAGQRNRYAVGTP